MSIHRNSYPTANAVSGVESLVYDKSGIKYEMAQNINEQLESIGFVNLGVKARPNLIVLRRTKMPAVLVETGFINSDIDNQLFDKNLMPSWMPLSQASKKVFHFPHNRFRNIITCRQDCSNMTSMPLTS